MATFTQEEITAMREQLATVRNQALSNLNEIVKEQRDFIWQQYYDALDMLGVDRDGKPKKDVQ